MRNLVSVVMPAFNVEAFVEEAVRTLHAQTYPAIELVAVNDGSTDRTGEILDRLAADWRGEGRRMIVLHQDNKGASAARNAGLAQASGDLIGLFDSDDRCDATMVEKLVLALESDKGLDLACPLYRYIDHENRITGVELRPRSLRLGTTDLMTRMMVHTPVFRREAADRTGLFDPALTACIDLDYYARMAAGRGRTIAIVPEVLADYRKRSGQITGSWTRLASNWERVLAKVAAAGHGLTPDEERRARARNQIYWATMAYQSGEYAAARRLVAASWARDPWWTALDRLARIRTLAAAASLLPDPLHRALRRFAGSAA